MNTTPLRKERKARRKAFYVARCGREKVPVYKRRTPSGTMGFIVANYSKGKRRFDSYTTEQDAIEAANKLARQMSERDVLSASMTREQSLEFAAAVQALSPYNVSVADAANKVAEVLKELGTLPMLSVTVQFYRQHHRQVVKRTVAEAAAELIKLKEARGASPRYMQDLRYRLGRFAEDCKKNIGDVGVADLQDWLDNLGQSSQSYRNFRAVLFTLFHFAETRAYVTGNPVVGVEMIKVKRGDIQIFSPQDIRRLLAAAKPDFVPSLSICAFAGLRTIEVIRLDWADIDLPARHIVIGASNSKTASRRIVPIADNLAEWLAPFARASGKVWNWPPDRFYRDQAMTARAAGMKDWKLNAMRHSYASYRYALIQDAPRTAAEMGNSPAMIFKHYRELVKPDAATAWFNVRPEEAATNIVPMAATAATP